MGENYGAGKRGWTEIPAPTATEEHSHYFVHKRMRADYLEGINRRRTPDNTHQATIADSQIGLAPLHRADPLMDPAVRTHPHTTGHCRTRQD